MKQGQRGSGRVHIHLHGGVWVSALAWVCMCETTGVAMWAVCVYTQVHGGVCTLRCMEVSVHRCVFIQPSLETDSEEDTAVHTHSLMHTRPQRPPLLSAQNTSARKTLRHHLGV